MLLWQTSTPFDQAVILKQQTAGRTSPETETRCSTRKSDSESRKPEGNSPIWHLLTSLHLTFLFWTMLVLVWTEEVWTWLATGSTLQLLKSLLNIKIDKTARKTMLRTDQEQTTVFQKPREQSLTPHSDFSEQQAKIEAQGSQGVSQMKISSTSLFQFLGTFRRASMSR